MTSVPPTTIQVEPIELMSPHARLPKLGPCQYLIAVVTHHAGTRSAWGITTQAAFTHFIKVRDAYATAHLYRVTLPPRPHNP